MVHTKYLYQRLAHGEDSSYGVLYKPDDTHQCFIIEDEPRQVKVAGETRIPAGTYEIKQREVLSGLTKRYREKYDWFEWHLELQDVQDFEYVYFHIGNFERNSDACLLCNYNVYTKGVEFEGGNSTNAFKDFYLEVCELLNSGVKVFVEIRDEDYLVNPF